MSNTEPNTQLPSPSPDDLPAVGLPLPIKKEGKENFLGASNAHMSELRLAQMRANVAAGYNPSGYGRLPGVDAPEFVPEPTNVVNPTDAITQTEQLSVDDILTRDIPEHLVAAPEDR